MTKNGQKMGQKVVKKPVFFTFFFKKKCVFDFAKTTFFFHHFFGLRKIEKVGLECEQLFLPDPKKSQKKSSDFLGLVNAFFRVQKWTHFWTLFFAVKNVRSKNSAFEGRTCSQKRGRDHFFDHFFSLKNHFFHFCQFFWKKSITDFYGVIFL